MVRLFIGLGIVALGLLIYCLIECIQTPRHRVRVMPKAAWLAIILLVPLLGPGLWMAFGRRKSTGGNAPRKGPTAPDDDPEFLRNIEFQRRQAARREEEARKRAEAERKKRQQNQQKNSDDGTPGAEGPGETDEGGRPQS